METRTLKLIWILVRVIFKEIWELLKGLVESVESEHDVTLTRWRG